MKKPIATISALSLAVLLTSFTNPPTTAAASTRKELSLGTSISAAKLYTRLGLESKGLSQKAFAAAFKGYEYLLKKKKITNTQYLTICDMSQSSAKKRLYVIDIANEQVIINTWVAHGRNSGHAYANRFSNRLSSHQTSLGFYITGKTYRGEHGLSLRLTGQEAGINDKAYRRAVVVHGANYIGENAQGRSFGCPAVPKQVCDDLIEMIKEGSCLFIYHPTQAYTKKSKILNG